MTRAGLGEVAGRVWEVVEVEGLSGGRKGEVKRWEGLWVERKRGWVDCWVSVYLCCSLLIMCH